VRCRLLEDSISASDGAPASPGRVVSEIAYVGHDGAIHTADLGDGGEEPITPSDTPFTWPTWSPDGGRIAASSFRSGINGHGRIDLYVLWLNGPSPRLIYTNEPGTDAIALRTPHYAIWSPDSRMLAFICQSPSHGLSLHVVDVEGSGELEHLLDGAPMYLAWSSDSRFLLVHSGSSHYLVDFEGTRDMREMPGTASASLYMTPSWGSVSGRAAMFRDLGQERQTLLVMDALGGGVEAVAEVDGAGAFAWRPDETAIGLARGLDRKSGYYAGLWLLASDGSGEQQLADEPLLCFFWSPKGDRVAYITPSEDAEGSVRWAVLDLQSSEIERFADFRPSQEQLTTFMFFDQYEKSHSPWSPDGNRLIFSGALGHEKERRALPAGPSTAVFVVDLRMDREPRQVAAGFAGFWRPV